MGWGSGNAKKEIIDVAGSGILDIEDVGSPFANKDVLIDISGIAHKASKRGQREVALHGTSLDQQEYMRKQIESVAAEGGRPVLILDGRAYPPKLTTRAERRARSTDAHAAARPSCGRSGRQGRLRNTSIC